MTEGIGEALKRISKVVSRKDRMQALKHASDTIPGFFKCLKHGYKDAITWRLPEGTPPYKRTEKAQDLQGNLIAKVRLFEYFAGHPELKKAKREEIFIQLLETVDPDDADVLLMIKDKKLEYSNRITKKLVTDTFPKETEGW